MKQTALHHQHAALQPRWAEFAGWQMPIDYGSQIEEHKAVRQAVGIFDVSHMQVVRIKGPQSIEFLSVLLANDVNKIPVGKAMYTCMLNERGGVIDDLIAYRVGELNTRLILNAGCAQKDLQWIRQHAKAWSGVEVIHEPEYCILAIQGPQAIRWMIEHLPHALAEPLQHLKSFEVFERDQWMVARTGYTGEHGVEVVLPPEEAIKLWSNALALGVKPIGLGARDTLRLEAGLNLYGQDMTEETTPWESRLGWTVSLETPRAFIGREAIERTRNTYTHHLIPVVMKDRGVLRHDQRVLVTLSDAHESSAEGVLTSGSYSPTLNCAIGFARIPVQTKTLAVDIRGRTAPLFPVKGPFVRLGHPTPEIKELLT